MVCNECGNKRESAEDFYLLSVQVKDKKDIYSGLKHMTNGEIINEYHCEHCNKKVDLTKKTCLKSLPNTLIVHLNRIVFDMETLDNVKVNDRLEFPTALNLRPYMLDEVNKADDQALAERKAAQVQENEGEQREPAEGNEDGKEAEGAQEEPPANLIDTSDNK